MSSAALAVGVSISGIFVLIIVGIVIVVCVLNKKSPRRGDGAQGKFTKVKKVKKSTKNIKEKAKKLKADKTQPSCCELLSCCASRRSDGPFPDPPIGVEVQDPSSSEITIVWDAPEAEVQAVTVVGYVIYKRLKINPNNWTRVGKVKAEELEYRITGLVPDRRYVFGVASKARTGESTIVESQPTVLKKDPVRPGAPAEFEATDKSSSSITLSWKPPRKEGYSRIHTYYIMIKDCDRNADWTHLTALPAFDRYMDYKVTGLKPKHAYRFRLNAENVAGLGPYAETVTCETADLEPEPPGKPKGPIKYSRISHSSVTVSWKPPEKDGGEPISGFAVEYKEKSSRGWHKAGVCEAGRTRLTVNGLQEDIEYIVRVVAINNVGNSKPLVGAKVRTKLLEIPLSRRSSVRLPSREETSRDSSREKPSLTDNVAKDINKTDSEENTLQTKLDVDLQQESDPHVPKSDFFIYDETNSGNISNRHSDNKTKHSQFSPLPAPPPSRSPKRSRKRHMGTKRRHSEYSPLPKPQYNLHVYSIGRMAHSGVSDVESENESNGYDEDEDTDHNTPGDYKGTGIHRRDKFSKDSENFSQSNTHSSILTELADSTRQGGLIRHQPTPSNIAYVHSRF